MKCNKSLIFIGLPFLFAYFSSCNAPTQKTQEKQEPKGFEVVASAPNQWTGVGVSKVDRVFVNYPYWSTNVPVSVAEIVDGKTVAYPDTAWNNRSNSNSFKAVQSVYVDAKDRLWVLDTNNPQFQGVKEGGPILYQFDLNSNTKTNAFTFPDSVFKPNSYFNDVRVDTNQEIAYMTDSGDGALIVLNLATGTSRRLLDNHTSTESEIDHLVCDGIKWENSIHSDGIALTPDNKYIYYVALTGHTLYRIPTVDLLNQELSVVELESKVETVSKIPATDGMLFDKKGRLWLGGLEDNSINRLHKDGKVEKVIADAEIRWADSFAQGADGSIYFTTSQIHLPAEKRKDYQVLKLKAE